jgi:hypothetical protein
LSLFGFSQTDTTKTNGLFYRPAKKQSPFTSEYGISTSNLWRGMDVGKQPVIKMIADYQPVQWFTVASEINVVYNQFRDGYGNTIKNSMMWYISVYSDALSVCCSLWL